MSEINETKFEFEFQPVTKLFEEQVSLNPNKTAVIAGDESLTYTQLNEKVNRVANSLLEKGAGREKIIGVMLERCCDFYSVRQGILKSGGAFVVATPEYPDDRVEYIFEDSEAMFVITTKDIAEKRKELFSKLKCDILLLDELLENANTTNPDVTRPLLLYIYIRFNRKAQGCYD